MIPTLWLDPIISDCSATYVAMDGKTYVKELIFSYCTQTMCDVCSLANRSARHMSFTKAWKYVQDAIYYASRQGFQRVLLRFVGGNIFHNWEDFCQLYEAIVLQKWDIPISFSLVICADELSEEKQTWLLQHSNRIQISFRWIGNKGVESWIRYPLLHHPMVSDVIWHLTKDTIDSMDKEVYALLKIEKNVRIEYIDIASWHEDDFQRFIRALSCLILHIKMDNLAFVHIFNPYGCSCSNTRYVELTDVDGRSYPCRYLSMERTIYSALNLTMARAEKNKSADCLKKEVSSEISPVITYLKNILTRVLELSNLHIT